MSHIKFLKRTFPATREGTKTIKYSTFIYVRQTKSIFNLTKLLRGSLIEADAWLAPKFTDPERVQRIGFLGGVNIRFSDIK